MDASYIVRRACRAEVGDITSSGLYDQPAINFATVMFVGVQLEGVFGL